MSDEETHTYSNFSIDRIDLNKNIVMRSLIIPECESCELYFLILPLTTEENLMVSERVGDSDDVGFERSIDFSDDRMLGVDFFGIEYTC